MTKKVLIVLLFIAIFLRAVDINNNPKSLYGDELTLAYDTFSILNTGHDSTGAFLPVTFKTGEGRPGGYIYASLPFEAVFGPTALGVRALSILSGVGIVLLMFFLGKKLFNDEVGLIAAGITTFSPWDISLSRGGFEAHFALFLALLGTTLLISSKSRKSWIIAATAFGLTFLTYPTYKLVLPPFLILLLWFLKFKVADIKSKRYLLALCIFAFLTLVAITQTFTGGSEQRFLGINAFSDHDTNEKIVQNLNAERANDQSSFSNLSHNKVLAYSNLLLTSYLENFSPDFLFISGDQNPVHNPATTGALFYIQILFSVIGLIYLIKEKRTRELFFLSGWILLAPLATAVILQTHFLRSAFMLPPLLIVSSLGVYYLWISRKRASFNLIFWIAVVGFVLQFGFFAEELYFVAGQKFEHFWAYPAKIASAQAIVEKNNFQSIFISAKIDSIEYGFPVYAKIAPNDVIKKTYQSIGGINFEKYGNVYIGEIPDNNVEQFLAGFGSPYLYIGPIDQRGALHNYQTIDSDSGLPQLVTEKSN